ncbi:MAG: hypothetical protein WB988_25315 [Candidatus Nitrosopolaris sp.]
MKFAFITAYDKIDKEQFDNHSSGGAVDPNCFITCNCLQIEIKVKAQKHRSIASTVCAF